jgi:hypothetical protein
MIAASLPSAGWKQRGYGPGAQGKIDRVDPLGQTNASDHFETIKKRIADSPLRPPRGNSWPGQETNLSRNPPERSARRFGISAVLLLAISVLTSTAHAYTDAGDRIFPANLILPQVTSTDAVWITPGTQPFEGVAAMNPTRQSVFPVTYSKLITEQLGIQVSDGIAREDRLGASSLDGAQNLDVLLQYELIHDPSHEFILSFQIEQNVGRTGDKSLKTYQQSFTQPGVTFAKGLGDLPNDYKYLRPLAIIGFTGYQIGEGGPNQVTVGAGVQYSIPYLVSKVTSVDLPRLLRGMTPMIEMLYMTPSGRGRGANTTLEVAPGVSYSQSSGWELAIEAQIPANRATGSGLGVIAQMVIELDYLLPDSLVGRPLFPHH